MTNKNKQALEALEENYPAFIKGTLVCVQNPNFKEDDGSNPWLVIDLAALQPKPSVDFSDPKVVREIVSNHRAETRPPAVDTYTTGIKHSKLYVSPAVDGLEEALEWLERVKRFYQSTQSGTRWEEIDEIYFNKIRAALQPKPSEVVEALKQDTIAKYTKGHSQGVKQLVYSLLNEVFDHLHSQGHLNQGWRDGVSFQWTDEMYRICRKLEIPIHKLNLDEFNQLRNAVNNAVLPKKRGQINETS